MYDVVIVGGGPAGLNAALVLGRCRRKVVLCDAGEPRNESAKAVNGYLGRDGIPPLILRGLGREEVQRYGVELVDTVVTAARTLTDHERPIGYTSAFEVKLAGGRTITARKLLLATGVRDFLPEIDGAKTYYGRGVYHCPYCDGWEHRDQKLIAYGEGVEAARLALSLKTWSTNITACPENAELPENLVDRLDRNGITLRNERIIRLEGTGEGGILERIVFESGHTQECDAFFFHAGQVQQSDLARQLGVEHNSEGELQTRGLQQTRIPGLYLAGDADGDVQFAIVAAGEGATAAVAINVELQKENTK